MDNATYNKLAEFFVGDRVELSPATDLWMRGARFGTVARVTKKHVHVKIDKLGIVKRFFVDYVNKID